MALGLVVTMRLPNAALLAAAIAVCLLYRQPRRAVAVAGAALLTLALATAGGQLLTGTANPYKAERTSFNGEVGYPAGADAERALARFSVAPATQAAGWHPELDASRTFYSSIYFLIGRHSGLLLYFPLALLLAYRALRRPDRKGLALLAGIAAIALFYLVWLPENFFGGSTFVGNRYFLTSYAALLVAAPGLPSGRQLVPVWLLASIVGLSALFSVESSRELDSMSQSHAYAGVFRLLPYESTAQEIDGQRDRYWSGDFVRFVDPHAEVDDFAFTLDSTRPAAELLVATAWQGSPIRLLVTSQSEPLELRVNDWGRSERYRLERSDSGSRAVVELETSSAWRRHRFWWSPEQLYDTRVLRLSLEAIGGNPARATVRYLGDGDALDRQPSREVLSAEMVPTDESTGVPHLSLEVRNTSEWTWTSESVIPLYLSYRLRAPDGVAIDGPRTPIGSPVEPGEILVHALPLAWPETPGDYRLTVDLVLEEVAWFEDRLGIPLFETTVAVE